MIAVTLSATTLREWFTGFLEFIPVLACSISNLSRVTEATGLDSAVSSSITEKLRTVDIPARMEAMLRELGWDFGTRSFRSFDGKLRALQLIDEFEKAEAISSAVNTAPSSRPHIASGSCSLQGTAPNMNDRSVCLDILSTKLAPPTSCWLLLDGFGGDACSQAVSELLPSHLAYQLQQQNSDVPKAVTSAFQAADAKLMMSTRGCGATCALAILQGADLHAANVGDAETVLFRRAADKLTSHTLSTLHTADVERERIEAAGGLVVQSRLFGVLSASRCFGSAEFKPPQFTSNLTPAEPSLSCVKLSADDVALVLGSSSFWAALSHTEIAEMLQEAIRAKNSAAATASRLAQAALDKGTNQSVTAVVVFFG